MGRGVVRRAQIRRAGDGVLRGLWCAWLRRCERCHVQMRLSRRLQWAAVRRPPLAAATTAPAAATPPAAATTSPAAAAAAPAAATLATALQDEVLVLRQRPAEIRAGPRHLSLRAAQADHVLLHLGLAVGRRGRPLLAVRGGVQLHAFSGRASAFAAPADKDLLLRAARRAPTPHTAAHNCAALAHRTLCARATQGHRQRAGPRSRARCRPGPESGSSALTTLAPNARPRATHPRQPCPRAAAEQRPAPAQGSGQSLTAR